MQFFMITIGIDYVVIMGSVPFRVYCRVKFIVE